MSVIISGNNDKNFQSSQTAVICQDQAIPTDNFNTSVRAAYYSVDHEAANCLVVQSCSDRGENQGH